MTKILYNFLSIHSIIIGMFTFFLPVLLYKTGFSLAQISGFISLTGGSFVLFLYIWDIIRAKYGIKSLIYISFIFEVLLIIFTFFIEKSFLFLLISSVLYGGFNCFFWVTQRVLFITDTHENDTGNKFGNIQIIAFGLVKVGIFIGGFLLENNYLYILLFLAILLNIYGFYYFGKIKIDKNFMNSFQNQTILPISKVLGFQDNLRSKIIFILDGPFLYLESFFWLITLFLLSDESYSELGLLIIFLAVSFSGIFLLLKKKVDILNPKKILFIGVILYSLSWLMRGGLSIIDNQLILYGVIIIIAFFTSFFRLIFNKQFFHTSKKVNTHTYMLIKSYYSQISLFFFFGLLSIIFYIFPGNISIQINIIYLLASIISFLFLLYIPYNDKKNI